MVRTLTASSCCFNLVVVVVDASLL
jgi:hypothetical protein